MGSHEVAPRPSINCSCLRSTMRKNISFSVRGSIIGYSSLISNDWQVRDWLWLYLGHAKLAIVVASNSVRLATLRRPRSERFLHGASAQAPNVVLLQPAEPRPRPEFVALRASPERLRLAPLAVSFLLCPSAAA